MARAVRWSEKTPLEQRLERLKEREGVSSWNKLAEGTGMTGEVLRKHAASTRNGELPGNFRTWQKLAKKYGLSLDWLADPTPLPAEYELPPREGQKPNFLPPIVHDLRVEAFKAQLRRDAVRLGYSEEDLALLLDGRAESAATRALGMMRDEGLPDFTQALIVAAMHLFGCSRQEALEAFAQAFREAEEDEREHRIWPEDWLTDIRNKLKERKAVRRGRGRRERTKSGEYASTWPPTSSSREPSDN